MRLQKWNLTQDLNILPLCHNHLWQTYHKLGDCETMVHAPIEAASLWYQLCCNTIINNITSWKRKISVLLLSHRNMLERYSNVPMVSGMSSSFTLPFFFFCCLLPGLKLSIWIFWKHKWSEWIGNSLLEMRSYQIKNGWLLLSCWVLQYVNMLPMIILTCWCVAGKQHNVYHVNQL